MITTALILDRSGIFKPEVDLRDGRIAAAGAARIARGHQRPTLRMAVRSSEHRSVEYEATEARRHTRRILSAAGCEVILESGFRPTTARAPVSGAWE